MSRMLRHVPTGDLYVFTSILAKRADMEMVEEVVEADPVEVVVEEAAVAVEVVAKEPVVKDKKSGTRAKKEVQSAETLSIDVEE